MLPQKSSPRNVVSHLSLPGYLMSKTVLARTFGPKEPFVLSQGKDL